MTQPTSGLLPALIGYYRRLEDDPDQHVADFGFSVEKIQFRVVLEPDGTLFAFEDIRERNERGKTTPRPMVVPDGGGRSGIGLKPFFCWDNTGYVLGRDNKANPARASEMFAAFRELHLSFRDALAGDEGFASLCRFLEAWDPARAEDLPNWEEAAGLNVVFKLRAREGHVHQSLAVREVWSRFADGQSEGEESVLGASLITGEREPLARLHPQLRGVAGANTTGAAIVSFNNDAFESYGKTQSYNAPVGARDAFRYTTALNRLLSDKTRKTRIGDATVVFWSDQAEGADGEEVLLPFFVDDAPGEVSAEHSATVARVRDFLEAARLGLASDEIKHPDAPFYILGLSANASRLNVRFWLTGTVGQFAKRLATHIDHLEMIGSRSNDLPPSIHRLVRETARETKDVSPQLAGEVARAVLGGLPYPRLLFIAVARRIRADPVVNHRRASILKAYLNRNLGMEVPVALEKEHPDETYQLGRMFAALEKTQEDVTEAKLNTTIKDSFFASAGATPASVFPRLLKLHSHHLRKLESEGLRVFREKLVGEIFGRIRSFPAHLPLEKQGLFYIGYYHQRQDFFTKRPENVKDTTHE